MPRTCNGELSLYALRLYVRFYYFSSKKITSFPPPAIQLFSFMSEGFDQDFCNSGVASI